MASERIKEDFSRTPPQIVEDDVKPDISSLVDKGCGQGLIWLVQGDDRIGPKIEQRLQHPRVSPGGHDPSGAQVPGDLDGQFASDSSRPEDKDCLAWL
jgi:hypothetical protein